MYARCRSGASGAARLAATATAQPVGLAPPPRPPEHSAREALSAMKGLAEDVGVSDGIRQALKLLSKG